MKPSILLSPNNLQLDPTISCALSNQGWLEGAQEEFRKHRTPWGKLLGDPGARLPVLVYLFNDPQERGEYVSHG